MAVVGTTGSGKTTLARQLAAHLELQHVEVDALHWMPSWTERPVEEFRTLLTQVLATERWVTDGNYGSKARDIILGRAQTVIWLDFPLHLVLRRLALRTFKRIRHKQELWHGNRETLKEFFSRDNVLWWAIKTHQRRRREYEKLIGGGQEFEGRVMRLKSAGEVEEFLAAVSETRTATV